MRDLAVDLALDAGEFLLDLDFTLGVDGHCRLPGDGGACNGFSAGDRFPKLSRGTAPKDGFASAPVSFLHAIESVMLPVLDLDPMLRPAIASDSGRRLPARIASAARSVGGESLQCLTARPFDPSSIRSASSIMSLFLCSGLMLG